MSTATADAPATVDPAELDLLDFEIECAMPECQRVAAWWSRCRRCNNHAPLCELHKRTHIESSRGNVLTGCSSCHAFVLDWRDLFEWIPIGGA